MLDLVIEPAACAGGADLVTVYASPVLAWQLRRHVAMPITARGLGDGRPQERDHPIEFPSGQVIATGCGAWPDRDAWVAGMTASFDHA